jgi:hypothetical protein
MSGNPRAIGKCGTISDSSTLRRLYLRCLPHFVNWLRPSFQRATVIVSVIAGLPDMSAVAQVLPSGPIVLARGNVTIGGDIAASIGPHDPGFFNYTDYELSALRLLQVDITGSAKAGSHLMLLGQVRTQNAESIDLLALYLRIRPWAMRGFGVQVGRIPRTFGAFLRRTYGSDTFLIGYPLIYQYLTSLRA